jgi:hypothetical protein
MRTIKIGDAMKVLLVEDDSSHSSCPECIELLHPDLTEDDDHELKRRKDDDHER